MEIQIRTDNHIEGSDALHREVVAEVEGALKRFGDRVTRVEVHLSDENSSKAGSHDKRCAMEARLAGLQPVAATNHGATLRQAFTGAAEKLAKAIENKVGRREGY
jgi:ribosome-associated translation inhibitor RaiA